MPTSNGYLIHRVSAHSIAGFVVVCEVLKDEGWVDRARRQLVPVFFYCAHL